MTDSHSSSPDLSALIDSMNEHGLIGAAQQAKRELIEKITHGQPDPELEAIASEYLPTYHVRTFTAVAKSIMAAIPEFVDRFVVETEKGELLYHNGQGVNRLVNQDIINSRISPTEGRTDAVLAHPTMTEPMVRAIISVFANTEMAYTIAGDNLYSGKTANMILPFLGMCRMRREERSPTYAKSMIRINKTLFEEGVDRVVFVQDGRGPLGLPKSAFSAILRGYLKESDSKPHLPYHMTTYSVSQSFHPDMEEIIAKVNGLSQGRKMNFYEVILSSSEAYRDIGERMRQINPDFSLDDFALYVTLPEVATKEKMLESLHLDPDSRSGYDQAALRMLQRAYEMTRVMSVDLFARAALKSMDAGTVDIGRAAEYFTSEARYISNAPQTYCPNSHMRLDPMIESLSPPDVERGFEFGRTFFMALGALDQNNNMLYEPTFQFYKNKTAVQFGEFKLKLAK